MVMASALGVVYVVVVVVVEVVGVYDTVDGLSVSMAGINGKVLVIATVITGNA